MEATRLCFSILGTEGPRQMFSCEPFNYIYHIVLEGLFHLHFFRVRKAVVLIIKMPAEETSSSSPSLPNSWGNRCIHILCLALFDSLLTPWTAEIIVGKSHTFLIAATWSSINVNSQSDWTIEQMGRGSLGSLLNFVICAIAFVPSVVFLGVIKAESIMFAFYYRPAYCIDHSGK